jgi:tetratricopeptide (TPR) repeat protein
MSANLPKSSLPQRQWPEAPAGPAQPAAVISALQADLERARGEYALRRWDSVSQLLNEIQKRIPPSELAPSPELESGYAFIEASLNTLRGRLLSRQDHEASRAAFRRAVDLFDKYAAEEGRPSISRITAAFRRLLGSDDKDPAGGEKQSISTRVYTDYGIALHRVDRNEDAIRVLSKVCNSGAAPPEAFGYLGYAEMTRRDLSAAIQWLRKGLELSPADPTMRFWLARALDLSGNKSAVAEAYCDAGTAAYNVGDYSAAGRCGLRGLRADPSNQRALEIAVASYRLLNRPGLGLAILERFLPKQPSNLAALGGKGMLLRECGQLDKSIDVLRSVPVDSADAAWVLVELAQSLRAARQSEEALKVANEAVRFLPENPYALRVQAAVLVDHGAYPEAVSALRQAEKVGGSSEALDIELGTALLWSGNFAAAKELFEKVVSADPRSVWAQFGLAACLENLGDPERALAYYKRAAHLDPKDPNIFLAIMDLLMRQDRQQEALDQIDDQLSGPLRFLALWYKGRLLASQNDWKAALETLEAAVKAAGEARVESAWPGIFVDFGDALRQDGQYDNAHKAYSRALQIDPNRVDAIAATARYHCDVAEFAEAQKCLTRALLSAPEEPSLWDLQGWCRQHLGNFPGALESYQRAWDLSKQTSPWYRKGLANVLLNMDPQKAREHFAAILEEQKYQPNPPASASERPSGNAGTLSLLGWCNYRLQRYDEAIRLFTTSLSGSSQLVPLWFDLGLVYLVSGRPGLAASAYESGNKGAANAEPPRRRGLYYIALFDLVDAARQTPLGPGGDDIFASLKARLESSGVQLETLNWLSWPPGERRPNVDEH